MQLIVYQRKIRKNDALTTYCTCGFINIHCIPIVVDFVNKLIHEIKY